MFDNKLTFKSILITVVLFKNSHILYSASIYFKLILSFSSYTPELTATQRCGDLQQQRCITCGIHEDSLGEQCVYYKSLEVYYQITRT